MTDAMDMAREQMRDELRRAVHAFRYSNVGDGPPRPVVAFWERAANLGLRIPENLFRQWLGANRLMPIVSWGDTAQALIRAGVADAHGDRAIVDPLKWRHFVQRVASSRPIDMPSGSDNQEFREWRYQNSSKAAQRKLRHAQSERKLDPPRVYDPELAQQAMQDAETLMTRRGGARLSHLGMLATLPSPDDERAWLPFAAAPSTVYWFWRWGTTKDKLRVAIRTHAQWAVDYKFGVVDITDPAATRWAWRKPLSGDVLFYTAVETCLHKYGRPLPVKVERRLREAMIELMHDAVAQEAPFWPKEFSDFDQAMNYVKAKAQALSERGVSQVSVKQLHNWFNLAL